MSLAVADDPRAPAETPGARRRRSVRLFWLHLVVAAGFMIAFVWVQAHR